MSYQSVMSERLYTLKEVVGFLCQSEDAGEEVKIMRQVRHWTASDLIPTVGKKHTGTGVSREYSAHEIRLAVILLELSHYRVPVTILESFDEMVGNYADAPEWQDAIAGKRPVFLQFAFNAHMNVWQLHGEHFKKNFLSSTFGGKENRALGVNSAIVINLTKVFQGLPK